MSRSVAIGIGCRAGVAGETIAALARRALAEAGAPKGETAIFTLAAKADEPGLIEAAHSWRGTYPAADRSAQGASRTHPYAFRGGAGALWRA